MTARTAARCRGNPWQQARRILGVRLDSIGDVLMTTPALRALRGGAPHREITLLTSEAGASLAALVPEVDCIIPYAAPWLKGAAPCPDGKSDLAMVDQLRARQFDAAVIFTVYSQSPLPSALLVYLADIPLRLAHCRENPYQLLTDWIPESEPEKLIRHEVKRQLDLVAAAGFETRNRRLSLRVPAAARKRLTALLAAEGLAGQPWVLIHPGATALSRRYPGEHYARVAQRFMFDYGLPVVFAGGETERELVDEIRTIALVPTYSFAGKLSLAETAALIAQAPILIANNSGPAHIAAAVGTPVVDLYALTNPQHTPWAVPNRVLNHDVPCKFCYKSICPQGHHNCLRLVEPETVVAATLSLLEETGRLPAQMPILPRPVAAKTGLA